MERTERITHPFNSQVIRRKGERMRQEIDEVMVGIICILGMFALIVLPLQCKRATLQRVVGHPVSIWDTIVFHN